MNKVLFFSIAGSLLILMSSCKKDAHVPPNIQFKTGASYTVEDTTVGLSKTITVGIIADKTEDDLKTYNISYAYDNAATTVTAKTFTLSSSENSHYENDYIITTRNKAGTEKWIFTVTDKDGNIAQKQIVLTVK